MKSTSNEASPDAIDRLIGFLENLCRNDSELGLVYKLAMNASRWSAVQNLLTSSERVVLDEIAFQSSVGGFSSINLKAHYVLDEDFINLGSAFILFALVGSDWTYVIRVSNQNRFTPASLWLAGEDL